MTTSLADAGEAKAATSFLEVTLKVDPKNRAAAGDVYKKFRGPFLKQAPGAVSKQLLIRDEDVQVLHGFDSAAHAAEYLKSALFNQDVVAGLKPLLEAAPEVRIYTAH